MGSPRTPVSHGVMSPVPPHSADRSSKRAYSRSVVASPNTGGRQRAHTAEGTTRHTSHSPLLCLDSVLPFGMSDATISAVGTTPLTPNTHNTNAVLSCGYFVASNRNLRYVVRVVGRSSISIEFTVAVSGQNWTLSLPLTEHMSDLIRIARQFSAYVERQNSLHKQSTESDPDSSSPKGIEKLFPLLNNSGSSILDEFCHQLLANIRLELADHVAARDRIISSEFDYDPFRRYVSATLYRILWLMAIKIQRLIRGFLTRTRGFGAVVRKHMLDYTEERDLLSGNHPLLRTSDGSVREAIRSLADNIQLRLDVELLKSRTADLASSIRSVTEETRQMDMRHTGDVLELRQMNGQLNSTIKNAMLEEIRVTRMAELEKLSMTVDKRFKDWDIQRTQIEEALEKVIALESLVVKSRAESDSSISRVENELLRRLHEVKTEIQHLQSASLTQLQAHTEEKRSSTELEIQSMMSSVESLKEELKIVREDLSRCRSDVEAKMEIRLEAEIAHRKQLEEEIVHRKQLEEEIVHRKQLEEEIAHRKQLEEEIAHRKQLEEEIAHRKQLEEEIAHRKQLEEEIAHRKQLEEEIAHRKQLEEELVATKQSFAQLLSFLSVQMPQFIPTFSSIAPEIPFTIPTDNQTPVENTPELDPVSLTEPLNSSCVPCAVPSECVTPRDDPSELIPTVFESESTALDIEGHITMIRKAHPADFSIILPALNFAEENDALDLVRVAFSASVDAAKSVAAEKLCEYSVIIFRTATKYCQLDLSILNNGFSILNTLTKVDLSSMPTLFTAGCYQILPFLASAASHPMNDFNTMTKITKCVIRLIDFSLKCSEEDRLQLISLYWNYAAAIFIPMCQSARQILSKDSNSTIGDLVLRVFFVLIGKEATLGDYSNTKFLIKQLGAVDPHGDLCFALLELASTNGKPLSVFLRLYTHLASSSENIFRTTLSQERFITLYLSILNSQLFHLPMVMEFLLRLTTYLCDGNKSMKSSLTDSGFCESILQAGLEEYNTCSDPVMVSRSLRLCCAGIMNVAYGLSSNPLLTEKIQAFLDLMVNLSIEISDNNLKVAATTVQSKLDLITAKAKKKMKKKKHSEGEDTSLE